MNPKVADILFLILTIALFVGVTILLVSIAFRPNPPILPTSGNGPPVTNYAYPRFPTIYADQNDDNPATQPH